MWGNVSGSLRTAYIPFSFSFFFFFIVARRKIFFTAAANVNGEKRRAISACPPTTDLHLILRPAFFIPRGFIILLTIPYGLMRAANNYREGPALGIDVKRLLLLQAAGIPKCRWARRDAIVKRKKKEKGKDGKVA